jgi:dihydroorotate dehydrogenase electron transfer subunit
MSAKQLQVKISSIKKVKKDFFLMSLQSRRLAKKASPGQFLHIKVCSTILRRPLSVHSVVGNNVFILFKVRGRGTSILSKYKKGETLDVIGPLGKGFKIPTKKKALHVLVAGGIGVAPLLFLAKKLKGERIVLLGANDKKDLLCEGAFKKLRCKVLVATDNGSKGQKGTVISILPKVINNKIKDKNIYIYACGPEPMFHEINKLVKRKKDIKCQVSFEQFMGCGLGICCGCTINTKDGYKKVCKDGPVFDINDIW